MKRQAQKIQVTDYPRTTYAVGENFDSKDMVVSIVYDNGDIEPTDSYTLDTSAFNSSAVGKTSVTVNADGFESVTLPVTIVSELNNQWRASTFGTRSSLV